MRIIEYNRNLAVKYAEKWASFRNPVYFNFDRNGGDCTNFVSQCIFAGCSKMNFTPVVGWYYLSSSNRTASWTGVEYLFNFLTTNKGAGPFAEQVDKSKVDVGDVIQLGHQTYDYYHAMLITKIDNGKIFVSAHTFDVFNKPLEQYFYENIRFLHIKGVRI